MLLSLVMGGRDFNERPIQLARVVKWYKREGEVVDYGDDVCDLWVREVRVPEGMWRLRAESWILGKEPSLIAEIAERQLAGDVPLSPLDATPLAELNPDAFDAANASRCGFLTRLTSSDRGILRRIYAPVGEVHEAGDILALLSTEANDPIEGGQESFERLVPFRVVENLILPELHPEGEDPYSKPWT